MASADTEVKPGFSWRHIALSSILLVIGGVIALVGNYVYAMLTKETKTVLVSTSSSDNLASLPLSTVQNLEVFLALPGNQNQLIKSLFKYDATIKNTSDQNLDDFIVHVNLPTGISFIAQPTITADPPELTGTVNVAPVASTSTKQEYKVDLLNPGQAIILSYYGYASEMLKPPPMSVIVQKKHWQQEAVSQSSLAERNELKILADQSALLVAVSWLFAMMTVGLMYWLLFFPYRYRDH
jgi:hypothetical protein